MIKAVPYIMTLGTKKFQEFLNIPFKFDYLYAPTDLLFDDWKYKDMVTWQKYSYENITLEVFSETYNIGGKKVFTLPVPVTINDFINDMFRLDIPLYWNNSINNMLQPQDYLPKDEIKNYYIKLLNKLDKSNELDLSNQI